LARLVALHHPAAWARSLERVQRQAQAEQAAVLTGRLAHDFGNILTGVLGFSELTLTRLAGDSPPPQYVQEVWQAAQRGAQWVHQLQLASRRTVPAFCPTALAPLVQQETARLRAAWGTDITLLAAVADDLPPLAADAEAVRQLLVALLENAREAIDGAGVVSLSARTVELTAEDCLDLLGRTQPGRHVEIAITDTGRGLAPGVRHRLFRAPLF